MTAACGCRTSPSGGAQRDGPPRRGGPSRTRVHGAHRPGALRRLPLLLPTTPPDCFMHDWPNAPSVDPLNALRRDVHAAGSLPVTAAELGGRFGIQRLTPNARAQIAADLADAGLLSTPAFTDAKRG